MPRIHFASKQHEQNFGKLKVKFPQVDREADYRAACYIAAHPSIFKCFNAFRQKHGPFDWYFDYLEDPDDFIARRDRGLTTGDTAPLTSQSRELLELGLSLWNSYKCDMSMVMDLDKELYLVALQAIDLKRRRPTIDYFDLADDLIDREPWE
ncbi:DUF2538 domain-containing protein [Cohnella lubricantis]|uniref:DUF2538 family protein n=1 Tax=Cohnella lubricantis TaxID=2163172 RepID=A0A841T8X2_9BACL|nr:DUF2538 family protein [Cohnella lubricantis]MBB6676465.1 DUF2538 family protein [Cohnella lubricantis]MBP2117081.1 hypothetical protein [Cohnella lubricantis]